jgi:nitroreductase
MDLYEAIEGRRSIRKFKKTPISRKLMEKIFDVALWAPSGMNRQSWKFYVVAGESKEELVRICSGSIQNLEPFLKKIFTEKPKVVEATRDFFRTLGNAPIVVCAYFEPSRLKDATGYQNVAAAIQNLLLVAHSEGLGSCWMTGPVYMEDEIDRFLGVDNLNLVAVIPMGYPDETPPAPPRRPDRIVYRGL